MGKEFLDNIPESTGNKSKLDKWDFIKKVFSQ
jgi:hypothetical protein